MESKPTVGTAGLLASVVPVLAGLVASAMLAVDYLRPAPVFCSEGGGCAELKHTIFAAPFGVPLPVVGLAGFVVLGIASLLPGRRARYVQFGLAGGAAMAGALLLVLQVLLGHLCPYCCVADVSALVAMGVAAWRLRSAPDAAPTLGWQLGSAGSFALAAGVPLLAGFRVDITPAVIHAEMAKAKKGEVTVVDFVDFECPFCRMTHAEIAPVLESHREQLHVVRRQVPLRMHPHAQDAARAACCGEKLGQGDAMADALFTAEVDELTPEGCEKIAARLGLPIEAFRACVKDPSTDASIEADKSEFKAAGGYALPTIWVGDTLLIGAQPREHVAEVVHAALAHAGG